MAPCLPTSITKISWLNLKISIPATPPTPVWDYYIRVTSSINISGVMLYFELLHFNLKGIKVTHTFDHEMKQGWRERLVQKSVPCPTSACPAAPVPAASAFCLPRASPIFLRIFDCLSYQPQTSFIDFPADKWRFNSLTLHNPFPVFIGHLCSFK